MKYLSNKDIEMIAERVITAYKRLPELNGTRIYKIEPELLLTKLLGLNIEYHHLSPDRSILGMTSFQEIGVEIFEEANPNTFFLLDGKTVLIEKDLTKSTNQRGRFNFTTMHEGSHQILQMLYPNEYGVKGNTQIHFYKANAESYNQDFDWEEWQANTLASALLLPKELILQGMFIFNLGEKINCLNRIYYPEVFNKFTALADFLGCSKTTLAIRMKKLGLLKEDYLNNPSDYFLIYPEVS